MTADELERVWAVMDEIGALIDVLEQPELADIRGSSEYALMAASMWQLIAYTRGAPAAAQYVDSTIAAAQRRVRKVIEQMEPVTSW